MYFNLWKDHGGAPLIPTSRVRVRGVLTSLPTSSGPIPKSDFDAYLNQRGVYFRLDGGAILSMDRPGSPLRRWCEQQNRKFIQVLDGAPSYLSEGSDIWKAMMLGETRFLSRDMKDAFRKTGTMHLFAISGLHIGIMAAILAVCLRWTGIPLRLNPLVGLPVLFLFVQITGNSPSAVRALIMVAFFWSATTFRRKASPLSAWMASALFVLIWQPGQILNPGFQLSYAVVGMILLYGLPLAEILSRHFQLFRNTPRGLLSSGQRFAQKFVNGFWDSLAISFSAFLISQPISIHYFGIFSPVSVALNLVLVLLAFPIILLGIGTISLGMILPTAWLLPLHWTACSLLEGMLWLLERVEGVPGTWYSLGGAGAIATASFTSLLLMMGYLGRASTHASHRILWAAVPPLAFFLLFPLYILSA
jgi:competence protein ComEC